MNDVAHRNTSLAVIGLILILAVAALATAYSYSGGSQLFPRFVGWLFVALSALELVLQLRAFAAQRAHKPDGQVDRAGNKVLKEVRGLLWITFFLAVLYLAGFLFAIAVYSFSFLRLSAGRPLWQCAVYSVSAVAFVYILFVQLMRYDLYAGVLLGN